jgi:arylsulfatase A-like enzyme
VSFHHGNTPTPNIDKLATQSVEITQHYVYPVCSPTRCAFLSGRYASRFGVTNPQNERAYRWDTVTLARALKSVGYDTALTGKWHLGSSPDWGPQKFGFDHSYGSLAGGVGPWDHRYKNGEFSRTWHRDGTLIDEQGHVTDLIAHEAIEWLSSRQDRPFFLYVPFTTVHIPIREPDEYVRNVPAAITEPSRREYAADVMHLDAMVGRLLEALKKSGKADNTIVVFTSDNGAYPNARNDDPLYPADNYTPGPAGGSNEPLRGMKGEVYEGGIRVPALVYWPARLKPGKFTTPVHITDWMPTFCALAGYKPEKDLHWDGRNIWPFLSGTEPPKPRSIYVAGTGFRSQALREGDWKLVVQHGAKKAGKATDKFELFDLGKDPNEMEDLSSVMPEKVAAMQVRLEEVSQADKDAVAND